MLKKIFLQPLASYCLIVIVASLVTSTLMYDPLWSIITIPFTIAYSLISILFIPKQKPLYTKNGLYFFQIEADYIHYLKATDIRILFLQFSTIETHAISDHKFDTIYQALKDIKQKIEYEASLKANKKKERKITGIEEFKNFNGHLKL